MTEKRVRWNPAQREVAERRKTQVVGALKVVGTLLFGTDKAVRELGDEAAADLRAQRDAARARHGALDTEGVAVDEDDDQVEDGDD